MLAELQKANPAVLFLLKLTVNGTEYNYAEVGGIWDGDGMYEARVLSWGGFSRGVNLRSNALELGKIDIIISDTDQAFAAAYEGADRNYFRNAGASVVLASPNVSSANWATVFSGRLDTVAQTEPLTWTLTLSYNDLPLLRDSVPKTKVSRADWPSCSVDVEGSAVPIIYGRISSTNDTNTGAVPTLLVDQAGARYLVGAGWITSVDPVYVDGTAVDSTNYTISRPVINGRQFTVIDFTSSQGDSTVTCDVEGYDSDGDGGGTLITDPPSIAKHALLNWIYGDYRSGAWITSGPVDATTFGTTFFSARGYEASLYVGAKRSGMEVLNDFLVSFEAKAYWTLDGDIALGIEDFTSSSLSTTHVLREDELAGWTLRYPTVNLVDRIEAEYAAYPTGSYAQYLNVKDLDTGEEAPEALQLPYSPCFMLS